MSSNIVNQGSKIRYVSKGNPVSKAVALAQAPTADRVDSPDLVPGGDVKDVFSRPSDLSSESDCRTTLEECMTTLELFNATPFVPRNRFVQPIITHTQHPPAQGATNGEGETLICKPGCLPVPKSFLKVRRSLVSLANSFKQGGEKPEDKGATE